MSWKLGAFFVLFVGSLGACATLNGSGPSGWHCTHNATDGDVSASSSRWLSPDGQPRAMSNMWHWSGGEGDIRLNLYERQERSEAAPLRFSMLINVPRGVHRKTAAAQFSLRDWTRNVRVRLDRSAPSHFHLEPAADMLLDLGAHGPVFFSGLDRSGAVTFRVEIDLQAVRRGRAALEEARNMSLTMSQDFRAKCQAEYDETIVLSHNLGPGGGALQARDL
ncbi:MAG TPA: hypothetical protein VGB54_00880 [Allosphingosinicella sp.]